MKKKIYSKEIAGEGEKEKGPYGVMRSLIRLNIKIKYICQSLVSLHVNFCFNRTVSGVRKKSQKNQKLAYCLIKLSILKIFGLFPPHHTNMNFMV